jgi:zinc/manganese transport system substrate-binding protein
MGIVCNNTECEDEVSAMRGPLIAAVVLVLVLAAGCATAPSRVGSDGRSGPIQVVAAENFWGSIAAQLGGDRVQVTSIIDNPDADPHDYEATAADGRAFAGADLTIVNGVGYDTWASDLTAANPSTSRVDLSVGDLVGAGPGANPHRWYDPADVAVVIDAITRRLDQLDPGSNGYYDQRRAAFGTTALAEYRGVIDDIRTRYTGTRVGASESIVSMLAPALGLDMITPSGFLLAVTEGVDPTAADKAAADRQIATGAVAVYVYNPQNASPDVQAQISAAQQRGIPLVRMSETMTPAGASWQQWQTAQLQALRAALERARG